MVSHLIPASLTILTPLLLGRNSSVVARSQSRRKGFNGDFWENPRHDEKREKPKTVLWNIFDHFESTFKDEEISESVFIYNSIFKKYTKSLSGNFLTLTLTVFLDWLIFRTIMLYLTKSTNRQIKQ